MLYALFVVYLSTENTIAAVALSWWFRLKSFKSYESLLGQYGAVLIDLDMTVHKCCTFHPTYRGASF